EMEHGGRLYFLDGLRGWAAVSVLLLHTFKVWLTSPEALLAHGYTFKEWLIEPEKMLANGYGRLLWLINHSPLAFISDGRLAVFVFFVISGVALSYPILKSPTPLRTISEMAAIRYPRLTIPIAISSLIAFLLVSAGWMFNKEAGAVTPSS